MKLPSNYTLSGCSHPDVDPECLQQPSEAEYLSNSQFLLGSRNETDYKERRKAIGICKPSLFSLLREHMLGMPGCFPGDIMHWGSLNWTDLVLALFRGTLQCEKPDSNDAWAWAVLKDDIWKAHGEAVTTATPYLPGTSMSLYYRIAASSSKCHYDPLPKRRGPRPFLAPDSFPGEEDYDAASRRHGLLAAQELRLLEHEGDAPRHEVNKWPVTQKQAPISPSGSSPSNGSSSNDGSCRKPSRASRSRAAATLHPTDISDTPECPAP
ncbi:hypothetical protein B0H13DRAFT_2354774 [Mycena leptocephala]|nr:hypothetical protein B0H13DRAFT_2354774 [Mycena leptocephala]